MTKNVSKALLIMLISISTLFVSCSKSTNVATKSESTKAESIAKVEKKTTTNKVVADVVEPDKDETIIPYVYPNEDQVIRGGNFIVSNGTEPESIDPQLIQGEPEHRIEYVLFEGLVANDPKTAKAIPGIAKSWDITNGGKTITFHLRDSQWSDGTPLTANDFVYSWQRELNPLTASPYSWFPEMFLKGAADYAAGKVGAEGLGVKALDDNTLQVDLVGPLPYAIDAFAHYTFYPVPQKTIEKYGDQWTQPGNMVSNGAFVLESHVPQSYISTVKNDKFWDVDHVYLDKITFLASDDYNTNYNMYIDNEVDWLPEVTTEKMASAKMRNDYKSNAKVATAYYSVQCSDKSLSDPLVREALSYAVDRDSMIENVLHGNQIPAWGMVPPMTGYSALEFPFDSYDEAKEIAQEKLAEAGYPNGIGFPTITILYNSNESNKKVAELLQANFKDVLGINCSLENQEWGTFLANRNSGQFQLARAGWTGDYQDPNTFLDMFITGAAMNGGNFKNAEYDSLIRKAATMNDGKARFDVLHQAEKILIEQQAVIPFYYYSSSALIDTDKWGGWFDNAMDYHNVRFVYRKK